MSPSILFFVALSENELRRVTFGLMPYFIAVINEK
jgi:hypothetical protein